MNDLTDRELQSLRNLGNEAETAADEIERLRHDIERHIAIVAESEAKLAEAQRDAARYRWLRDAACDHEVSPWVTAWNDPDNTALGEHLCEGPELDAAIDAAMAGDKP